MGGNFTPAPTLPPPQNQPPKSPPRLGLKGVLKNNFSKNIVKDYCERVHFLVNLLIEKKQAMPFSKFWKQFQMAASENSFKSAKGCFWN